MGREIRRVPPDWQHPTYQDLYDAGFIHSIPTYVNKESYHPMHNKSFAQASQEWKLAFIEWEKGYRPEFYINHPDGQYWEYESPPSRAYYREREWTPEEDTAHQVYESITEGTPVSPVFTTRESLYAWLVENLEFSPSGADQFINFGSTFGSFNSRGEANYQMIDPAAKGYESDI